MKTLKDAIDLIMAQPPELHYPAYFVDLLRQADLPDRNVGKCSEIPNGSETIYRQDAIDAIHCDITVTGRQNAEVVSKTIAAFVDRIRALPPAQPEPAWIPVGERLPEEEDSIFARYYGTDIWRKSMFRKKSREVIVTSVFKDGELHTEVAHTTDGEWHVGANVVPRTVIAWMPLPVPYGGDERDV